MRKKYIPSSKKEFKEIIKTNNHKQLIKKGVGIWCKFVENNKDTFYLKPNKVHYLIPGTWFNFIPENFTLVSLSGSKIKFNKKTADNDVRYSYLAYGFIK